MISQPIFPPARLRTAARAGRHWFAIAALGIATGLASGCGDIELAIDRYRCSPGATDTCPVGWVCAPGAAPGQFRCRPATRITGVDATGVLRPIAANPADEAGLNAIADQVRAPHRIDDADPVLVIYGSGFTGTTRVSAEGRAGQGTIAFDIRPGSTDEILRVGFPATSAVSTGGLFLLNLESPGGTATAQIYLLRGEKGDPCTCDTIDGTTIVEGNVNIAADADVTGSVSPGRLDALPPCPGDYILDPTAFGADPDVDVCRNPTNGDEIVRVGEIWVDRYEATIFPTPSCDGSAFGTTSNNWASVETSFPFNGEYSAPLYACSIPGRQPSRGMTWFQAQAACAASGKHLITNTEWQAAVIGTVDPGAADGSAGGVCHTSGAGVRLTGQAGNEPGGGTSCVSYFGVEDLIGNVWEWTADWHEAGVQPAGWVSGHVSSWGPDYRQDYTWNVLGAAHSTADGTRFVDGLPAATIRGGGFENGSDGGAFSVNLIHAPKDYLYRVIGFRCAKSR